MIDIQMARPHFRGYPRKIKQFAQDRGGVAAIEFAFMVPVLLCLYLGSMEVGQAIEANKKVGRIASMVADLTTQQQAVTAADIKGIMQIGSAVIRPYSRSAPTIKVTGIDISDEATPRVVEQWWRTLSATGTASGGKSTTQSANPALPDKLKERKTFLVRVEASMTYKLILTYNESRANRFGLGRFFDGITMSETYYARPRISEKVTCDDCNAAAG